MTGTLSPEAEIQTLIDLVSNTVDAYTTVLFLSPGEGQPLAMHAYQSLSRNIDESVRIGLGEGLVGWVHKSNQVVAVDQFDRDTRRLLFYRTDENIKSFVAVPLPRVNGVLAVDSKQRYVFTDKSQKILHQFGQAIEATLTRLRETRQKDEMVETANFVAELEQTLAMRLDAGQTPTRVMNLTRQYAGTGAAFLVAVLPGDPDHYYLMGQDPPTPRLGHEPIPLDSGLAGWVLQKGQPLILDHPRSDPERSFLFRRDEAIKFGAFAGWPLTWGGRQRGALILSGTHPLGLSEARLKGIETAGIRLAAALEMELLMQRAGELSRLDAQVGLPHRTYFTRRLTRMIKMLSVKGGGLTLIVMEMNGLARAAVESGQEAIQEFLKGTVRHLLGICPQESELGHLGYGLLAVALMGCGEDDVRKIIADFAATVADWPLESTEGRVQTQLRSASVAYPAAGRRAEELIAAALEILERQPRPETGVEK